MKKRIKRFRQEFKKETIAAITAALGFLIALSWRTPIKNLADKIIQNLGLSGQQILLEFIAAIIVTMVAVLTLILISSWKSQNGN